MGWLCGLRECDRVLRGRADRRNMSASVDMVRNVEIHSKKKKSKKPKIILKLLFWPTRALECISQTEFTINYVKENNLKHFARH